MKGLHVRMDGTVCFDLCHFYMRSLINLFLLLHKSMFGGKTMKIYISIFNVFFVLKMYFSNERNAFSLKMCLKKHQKNLYMNFKMYWVNLLGQKPDLEYS